MAHLVFTSPSVTLNSVDLSDHVRSVSLDYKADMVDDTNAGDTTRVRLGGIKDWTLTIEFAQDFAADDVDATMFPLVGTTFAIAVRPTSAAASATNPEYTGTGILESYPPLGNGIGDLATTSVTIQAASALSRGVGS